MIENKFPMNYFSQAINPKKMFLGRKTLRWYQKILITLFLLSLMLIPISIQSKNVPSIKIDALYPKLVEQLKSDESNKEMLQTIHIEDGNLVNQQTSKHSNNVMINPTKSGLKNGKNMVVFYPDKLILNDSEKSINIGFDKNLSIAGFQSIDDLITFVEEKWNEQTVFYRTIGYTVIIGMLVLVSSLLLVFGTSLFIYLTRKKHLSNVKTYGEATNIVINALFIPTVIASVLGMFHYDVSLMLTIQALGVAVNILLIFVKTKFNDSLITVKTKNQNMI